MVGNDTYSRRDGNVKPSIYAGLTLAILTDSYTPNIKSGCDSYMPNCNKWVADKHYSTGTLTKGCK